TLQGVVPGYLDASMAAFARNQEKMREQMQSAFGTNAAMAGLEAMTRHNLELFENAMRVFSPFGQGGQAGKGGPAAAGQADKPAGTSDESESQSASKSGRSARDVDLDALKTQLAQMQEQLSKLVNKD